MTDGTIDVADIPAAELLAALYNKGRPTGIGFLQAHDGDMTIEQASALLNGDEQEGDYPVNHDRSEDKPAYFDYLHGRVMKVEINGKTLRPGLYDRDYGAGAAQGVVDAIREAA